MITQSRRTDAEFRIIILCVSAALRELFMTDLRSMTLANQKRFCPPVARFPMSTK